MMSVLQIIKKGENGKDEFKETFHVNVKTGKKDKSLKKEVSRAVAGMLNSDGGLILIGIANDGTIEGVARDLYYYNASTNQENKDKMRIDIDDTLTTDFGIMVKKNLDLSYEELKGKEIFIIKILPSSLPVFLNKVFYVRDGARTIQLEGPTLGEYIFKRSKLSKDEKPSIQAFYNRVATFLRNLVTGRLLNVEIKKIVQQLNDSDEKVYFGIEITQTILGSNINFMNYQYKLKISHDLTGTRKNLQKNNYSIKMRNFTNILILLHDLRDFLMENYGFEIHLPTNFPMCEVDIAIQYYQNMEITKHLELSIKNNNKHPLEISKFGIDYGAGYFLVEEKFIIKPMDNHFSRPISYGLIKKQLKDANVVKPYILRGCAKLTTSELFFSKKITL